MLGSASNTGSTLTGIPDFFLKPIYRYWVGSMEVFRYSIYKKYLKLWNENNFIFYLKCIHLSVEQTNQNTQSDTARKITQIRIMTHDQQE